MISLFIIYFGGLFIMAKFWPLAAIRWSNKFYPSLLSRVEALWDVPAITNIHSALHLRTDTNTSTALYHYTPATPTSSIFKGRERDLLGSEERFCRFTFWKLRQSTTRVIEAPGEHLRNNRKALSIMWVLRPGVFNNMVLKLVRMSAGTMVGKRVRR